MRHYGNEKLLAAIFSHLKTTHFETCARKKKPLQIYHYNTPCRFLHITAMGFENSHTKFGVLLSMHVCVMTALGFRGADF